MATKPHFTFFGKKNQKLAEKLLVQAIKVAGINVVYLPRQFAKLDKLYGEDVLSSFSTRYDMEMYVESFSGWEGEREFLTKFGLEIHDSAIMVVAKDTFDRACNGALTRPKEGDLIYYPVTKSLLEIKFVDVEAPFYQFGSWHRYTLHVELFQLSHEPIETGLPEIDTIAEQREYTQELLLGSGSGTYTHDEWVYQGASLVQATAKGAVRSVDGARLIIGEVAGEWAVNATLVGNTSGAGYLIQAVNQLEIPTEVSDNKVIEDEAAVIIDTTRRNPFGTP